MIIVLIIVGMMMVDFVICLLGIGYFGGLLILLVCVVVLLVLWYCMLGLVLVVIVYEFCVEFFYWIMIIFL